MERILDVNLNDQPPEKIFRIPNLQCQFVTKRNGESNIRSNCSILCRISCHIEMKNTKKKVATRYAESNICDRRYFSFWLGGTERVT